MTGAKKSGWQGISLLVTLLLYVKKYFFNPEETRFPKVVPQTSLPQGFWSPNKNVTNDLVGRLVEATGLTRKAIIRILTGSNKATFDQFKYNPEEFIIKALQFINDQKATAIIEYITYNVLEDHYETDIFTEPTIMGKLGTNAMKANKHLYDHIIYDSTNERDFAAELDTSKDVAVYLKLSDGFFISTPVGHYNPYWAIFGGRDQGFLGHPAF